MYDGKKEIRKIKISDIIIPEVRARSRFTDEQLEFLKQSLGKFGVLSYPIVRPLNNGKYELVDGEHRIKAAREQNLEEVECVVLPADERDAALINILMNAARGTQDPIGIAVAIDKALKAGMSIPEVAKVFNRSEHWVKLYHSLLDLPEVYRKALEEGKLTVSHIREAGRLPDIYELDAALQTALKLNWPASVLKNYVDNRLEQLRVHREQVQATGIETPPPPPEPEKLVKYGQCLICGRMVPRDKLYLPSTCEDCYQLEKYIVSNIGTGKEAMDYIYTAINHYQAYLRYQQQFMAEQQMRASNYPVAPPPQKQPSQEKKEIQE